MIVRRFWQHHIEACWDERRIVWLTAPRRLGKSTLALSLDDVRYFDCDLPSVRRDADDAESFLRNQRGGRLVLDEIHRLANPSELLKIAHDHFPDTRILATGSSTLGASARFRDTLAGRKRTVRLRPVLFRELGSFGGASLRHRLLHGGLPENLLSPALRDADFVEWREAFWARDILELFPVSKRYSFLRFLELLWAQSGGLCQLTSFTAPCEASRQTLANYLDILSATGVVVVLRPFETNPARELVAMPKVYAFDTGFVYHSRGWKDLRPDDLGNLWEHMVLDELLASVDEDSIHYWRTKDKKEIDFVLKRRGHPAVAIECKWKGREWNAGAYRAFRALHPDACCWVIAQDRDAIFERQHDGGFTVIEAGLGQLPELLARAAA